MFCSAAHWSLPQKLVSSDTALQSLYALRNDSTQVRFWSTRCTQYQRSLKCAIQEVLTDQLCALTVSFTIMCLLLKYKRHTLESATLITNDDALAPFCLYSKCKSGALDSMPRAKGETTDKQPDVINNQFLGNIFSSLDFSASLILSTSTNQKSTQSDTLSVLPEYLVYCTHHAEHLGLIFFSKNFPNRTHFIQKHQRD